METLPRLFGSYVLLERLARGGMGEIYLAHHADDPNKRYVALKTLREDLTRDKEYVTRFLDEARVAIVLDHPVINRVFDVGFAEGTYYLELEYISGRDLRSLLDRARDLERKIPREIGLHIIAELLSALGYLHRARDINGTKLNLIHRDVSPQNLMLFWNGRANLIDFGLARFAARSTATQPGMVMGKLRYMAPEQAQGKAMDRRVDLFAVGVMLYEAISGRRLYENVNPNELWDTVAQGRALASVQEDLIPADLLAIVQRAMAVEASDRYPDADAFLADIKQCSHEKSGDSRTALKELLADLFEVDLKLEQEFMEKLGHAAPFDLSTTESTMSVSLADPSACVPETTEALVSNPELEPAAAVVIKVQASPQNNLHDNNQVPDNYQGIPKEISGLDDLPTLSGQAEITSPESAFFAANAADENLSTNIDPSVGEQTFIVDRRQADAQIEQTKQSQRESVVGEITKRDESSLAPTKPSSAVQNPILYKFVQFWQDKPLRYAILAAGAALIILLFVLLLPRFAQNKRSHTSAKIATSSAQQSQQHGIKGRKILAAQQGKKNTLKQPKQDRKKLSPKAGSQKANSPVLDKNNKKKPTADLAKTQNTVVSDRQKSATVRTTKKRSRKARPKNLSSDAKKMLAALNAKMRLKGLSVEDGLDLWPEFRGLRDASLPERRRKERVQSIQKKISLFVPNRHFIRSKLFRIQSRYQKIRPRLNQSSPMFKDLERRHINALQSFTNARSSEDYNKVNTVLNQFALAVRLAGN